MSYADWRGEFAKGTDARTYPIEWLDWMLDYAKARFWESDEAAIVAEIRKFPTGLTEVHGLIAAGTIEGVKALIPLAEQWGREEGCFRASITSRPGWAKALDDYEPSQVTVVKEF